MGARRISMGALLVACQTRIRCVFPVRFCGAGMEFAPAVVIFLAAAARFPPSVVVARLIRTAFVHTWRIITYRILFIRHCCPRLPCASVELPQLGRAVFLDELERGGGDAG